MTEDTSNNNSKKIKELHNIAVKMEKANSEEEIYNIILESARQILDFYACSVDILEGDKFKVKAMRGGVQEEGTIYDIEGIAGKTVKENKSIITNNIDEEAEAVPKSEKYRSAISIPLGKFGVFQALSEEKNHFDKKDLELAEILIKHATEAVNRIRTGRELEIKNKKVTKLHDKATELEKCKNEKEICELMVETSKDILDFEVCGIDYVEDGEFVPKAFSTEIEGGFIKRKVEEAGISKKVYNEKKSMLVQDSRELDYSKPVVSDYRSSITIPMGDFGIYQAVSTEVGAFDEKDLELAEILVKHATEAIHRLRFEDELKDKNNKIKKLHDTAVNMGDCKKEDDLYKLTIDAAKNVLDFAVCNILIEIDGDGFEVKATSYDDINEGDILPLRDSIYTKTFLKKKSYMVDNLNDLEGAKPSRPEFKSAISIPIGDIGVFQGLSERPNNFDKNDIELAELLVSHLQETINRLRNEKKVKESEKRYRAIFNNTGTAKIIVDEELTIELVNNEFQKLSGYKKNELEDHFKFGDFLFEDDINEVSDFMEKVKDKYDNISKKFDLRFIDKNGNIKETFCAVSNIPDENKFNISIMDLTDLKWAVEELKKSEKKYHTIFENSGTAMLKIRKDTIVEMVNSKFVELFGYTKKEVEGKKSWTELVVQDYLPKMERYHQIRRNDPEAAPSSYECEVIDKAGNIRRVILNVSMIPGTDKSLVSIVDISDKEGFVEFGAMLDGLDIGMFILNSEGIITKANDKILELLKISDDNIVGQDYKNTLLSDLDNVTGNLASDRSKFYLSKIEIVDAEGNKFKAELNSSLIRDENNDESYILCQISPISRDDL